MESNANAEHDETMGMHERARRQKMQKLQALGVDPWGARFSDRESIQSIRARATEIRFAGDDGTTRPLPPLEVQEGAGREP